MNIGWICHHVCSLSLQHCLMYQNVKLQSGDWMKKVMSPFEIIRWNWCLVIPTKNFKDWNIKKSKTNKIKKRVQIQNTEADLRAGLLPFTPDAWEVVHLPLRHNTVITAFLEWILILCLSLVLFMSACIAAASITLRISAMARWSPAFLSSWVHLFRSLRRIHWLKRFRLYLLFYYFI